MLKTFLKHYLELPTKNPELVFIGGGVGTAQVLKGLRGSSFNLTAIVSMADDGGSAGRLRRAFSVPPPGDLVNCLAALSSEESALKNLLTYRFAGKRYGKDTDLGGHKLGNLIFVALTDIYKGDTSIALEEFSKIISPHGRVLPATLGNVNIWAKTQNGKKIYGESNIDLGKYNGSSSLEKVYLDPSNIGAYKPTLHAIDNAQMIITGPGDLFSTVLPVLIVPQIKKAFTKSKAKKVFILNIANKPFETVGFTASDHLETLKKHLGGTFFDTILINSNHQVPIPRKIRYQYVKNDLENLSKYNAKIIEDDFVDANFPIYHDSQKIADAIKSLN